MLKVLRPGVRHDQVELWEEFLCGYGFYNVEVDGFFDTNSVDSTKLFQDEHGLKVDGWVGGKTWGKAIELGLDVVEDDAEERAGPNWPPPPTDLKPLVGTAARQEVWGKFKYKAAGFRGNPEAIKILDDWPEKQLSHLNMPQIACISGMEYRGRVEGAGSTTVSVHRLVKDSFVELWKAWGEAGLLPHIITWAGTWNPRFIRGSRTTLSNHAFATAFDINASWNGLRRIPALFGRRGCVRELVVIANELGWWWGGHGWPPNYDRRDGMHWEATEKAIR